MLERLRAALQRSPAPGLVPGRPGAAAGIDALLMLEARAAEGVVRVSPRSDAPDTPEANLFGAPVTQVASPDARAALACVLGMAEGGMRAALALTGPELEQGLDLLASAAGRGIPLVAHLVNTARPGAGSTGETGHEAYHAAAETGAVMLMASSVQEAVDLAQVARRVAERELVPAVVALDGPETAHAVQDVHFPENRQLAAYLGDPRETLHAEGAAQVMIQGKHRRRVPRRSDLGRPALDNPVLDARSFGLAAAARAAYLQPRLAGALTAAFADLGAVTGRPLSAVTEHRVDKAKVVLVTQGSLAEPVAAAVDRARAKRVPAGALTVRQLRPFPAQAVIAALSGAQVVAVLERTVPAAGAEPPLTREVRAVLAAAAAGSRRKAPVVVPVIAAAPARAADLDALIQRLRGDAVPRLVWLGADLSGRDDTFPKTRVVFDALRRDVPEAEALGVRAPAGAPPALPEGAALAVVYRAGAADLSRAAARLAHGAGATRVRLRHVGHRGLLAEDRLLIRAGDPGADAPADVAVWLPRTPAPPAAVHPVRSGGALLMERDPAGTWKTLPLETRARVRDGSLRLFVVGGKPGESETLREERMLGALLALFLKEGHVTANPRKLLGTRREMLAGVDDIDARLDRFQEGLDGLLPFQPGPEPALAPETSGNRAPAAAVRRLKFPEPTADSLPRFWDHVGVRYERGREDSLAADPCLASGVLPPLTAVLGTRPATSAMLPEFVASNCTGCGACWTACPDAAIHAVPIGAQKLVETGMNLVREDGGSAEPLRMALGKIAARMTADPRPRTGRAALESAFAGFVEGAKLEGDRLVALSAASTAVGIELEPIPLACTDVFLVDREAAKRGAGEFLTLGVDPDACTSCGLCVSACEPRALVAGGRNPAATAAARKTVSCVDALPAPAPETLAFAAAHKDCGPLAAALLGPVRELIAGGDGAGPGSGRRLALLQILGAAAAERANATATFRTDVTKLSEDLGARIRDRLAGALPTRDLEALAEGLRAVQRPDVELGDLTARVETAFTHERVDTADMQRLVDAARGVNDVLWRLAEGDRGVGEAPFALVASTAAAAWLGTFPDHATRLPVTLDAGGDVFALARGVWEGQLRRALDAIRAVRWGRLELSRPAEAAAEKERLQRLGWTDLTDDERRACPPLFVFATEADARVHAASLTDLLDGTHPMKVVLVSDEKSGMGGASGLVTSTGFLESFHGTSRFPAPSHPRTFLLQTAVGHDRHLAEGVSAAVDHTGPAWIRVLAPEPAAGGFAPDLLLERARGMVTSRAWPLWRRDPAGPDGVVPKIVVEGVEAETEIIQPEPSPPAAVSEGQLEALRAEFEHKLEESRTASRVELARDIQFRLRSLLTASPAGNGKGRE